MIYTEPSVLSWPFGEKTILWLADANKYILAETPAVEVINRVVKGEDIDSIMHFCTDKFDIPSEQAEAFVRNIQQHLNEYLQPEILPQKQFANPTTIQQRPVMVSKRYYLIYGISFFVEYETKEAELLIHPKFEHLEVPRVQSPDHHFQVFNSNNESSLWVDEVLIGTWNWNDNHFLSGKFSMQVIQKIYQQEENEWMAVFHAAGITNGESCLIFLGDSGNGKSTLSAILMANGLEVLADDFLPIESKSELVCSFPSAISVKHKAFQLLIPKFPQLEHATEINNSAAGKTFRHLPTNRLQPLRVPCKALIFVKYEENAGFCLEKMPGEEAFEHLVPDSWISPTVENANRFVNWFAHLPYYRMIYSDNEQMIQMANKMLNDDL